MKKGNKALRDDVTRRWPRPSKDGTYDKIYEKWIGVGAARADVGVTMAAGRPHGRPPEATR